MWYLKGKEEKILVFLICTKGLSATVSCALTNPSVINVDRNKCCSFTKKLKRERNLETILADVIKDQERNCTLLLVVSADKPLNTVYYLSACVQTTYYQTLLTCFFSLTFVW